MHRWLCDACAERDGAGPGECSCTAGRCEACGKGGPVKWRVGSAQAVAALGKLNTLIVELAKLAAQIDHKDEVECARGLSEPSQGELF